MTSVLAYLPSPPQGVWYLGPLPIRAYAFCIIIGIVAALIIGDRRWQARGGETGVIYDIALWAVPFGLIGGRMYHVLTDWEKYFGEDGTGLAGAARIWEGGLGIWGAVALGGVGAWIACRRRGIPLPAFGDAIAPGIILAQAIGRLGNYFNQELFGRQTTLPWGLEIYQRVPDDLNGVSNGVLVQIVHPTFLYELLWNLLVFAVLIFADRRFRLGHGRLFALYVAGYCLGRFWIELLRSDFATEFAGIRVNSFTSGFVFLGAVIYIMVAPRGREDPETLRGTTAEGEPSRVEDLAKAVAGTAAGTSGVVAAAEVAGREESADGDAPESEARVEAETLAADVEDAPSEEIVAAEEFAAAGDGVSGKAEAVAEAEALAADVEDAPSEDIVEAEEFAAAGDGVSGKAEAVAEAEALAADVEDAPSEDIVEAEEFAAAGAEAEASVDAESAVGGVGDVEGEDAADAQAAAVEAHDAAVEGADVAEALEADVAGESPDDEAADEATEEEVTDEEVTDGDAVQDESAPAVGGVGDVEGEDAADAQAAAVEAHDAAVEGADVAEALEADVAGESPDAEATPKVGGVGDVEGEDAAEAQAAAGEAHDAAVEGADVAEALEADVVGESPDAEATDEEITGEEVADGDAAQDESAPAVGGVGDVEGEDAAEAQAAAGEAHDAAVEGAELAEALESEITESDDAPADDTAEADAEDVVAPIGEDPAASVDVDDVTTASGDESAAEVDGAAEDSADAVDESERVESAPLGEDPTASADAEEVAEEGDSADAEPDATDAGGVGAVDGEETEDVVTAAADAHESTTEGLGEAEVTAAEATDDKTEDTAAEPVSTASPAPRRRRWWRRNR